MRILKLVLFPHISHLIMVNTILHFPFLFDIFFFCCTHCFSWINIENLFLFGFIHFRCASSPFIWLCQWIKKYCVGIRRPNRIWYDYICTNAYIFSHPLRYLFDEYWPLTLSNVISFHGYETAPCSLQPHLICWAAFDTLNMRLKRLHNEMQKIQKLLQCLILVIYVFAMSMKEILYFIWNVIKSNIGWRVSNNE